MQTLFNCSFIRTFTQLRIITNSLGIPQESVWNLRLSNVPRIFAIYQDLLRFYNCDGCIPLPHAISPRTMNRYMDLHHFCYRIIAKTSHPPFSSKKVIVSLQTSEHLQARQHFRCRRMAKVAHAIREVKQRSSFRWGPVNISIENTIFAADM